MDASHFNVLTATDSAEQSHALARAIVDQRLAACVQITPIQSIYRWRGSVVDAKEWRLDCKTTAERLPDLISVIRDLHPFEVPEIIALPIADGNQVYLQWIQDETAP